MYLVQKVRLLERLGKLDCLGNFGKPKLPYFGLAGLAPHIGPEFI